METFEAILEQVMELPLDQQALLIEIVSRRMAEQRRQALATSSQEALEEFRTGKLKTLTAKEAIAELRTS